MNQVVVVELMVASEVALAAGVAMTAVAIGLVPAGKGVVEVVEAEMVVAVAAMVTMACPQAAAARAVACAELC